MISHNLIFKAFTFWTGFIAILCPPAFAVDILPHQAHYSLNLEEVNLTQPTQSTHLLPPNIYFPLSATKKSMENIVKGDKVQNYILYDGASNEAVRVSDLLAGPAKLPNDLPDTVKPFVKEGGWKVVTSFFDLSEVDSEASSTHVADIYENGVTTKLKISNPQLVATGVLDQFEALPAAKCN